MCEKPRGRLVRVLGAGTAAAVVGLSLAVVAPAAPSNAGGIQGAATPAVSSVTAIYCGDSYTYYQPSGWPAADKYKACIKVGWTNGIRSAAGVLHYLHHVANGTRYICGNAVVWRNGALKVASTGYPGAPPPHCLYMWGGMTRDFETNTFGIVQEACRYDAYAWPGNETRWSQETVYLTGPA